MNQTLRVDEIKKSNYQKIPIYKELWFRFWSKRTFLNIFLLISVICNILQLTNSKGLNNLVDVLFINKEGKFEWAGITAVVAIISLTATILITVSKNKADLISKSRIEWLQKVKMLTSEYLADLNYYPFLYKKYKSTIKDCKEKTVLYQEINNLASKIERTQYLLLLNLSDNKDNKQINNCIVECVNWVNSFEKVYGDKEYWENIEYNTNPVTNLLLVSRDYYKREWIMAKRGK